MSKKIGERIRMYRAMQGFSQDYLAEEIGMSAGNLGKIERGEIDVNTAHLYKIAKVLKVNISELFEEKAIIKDKSNPYGFATSEELRSLTETVQLLMEEMKEFRKTIRPSRSKTLKKSKSKA